MGFKPYRADTPSEVTLRVVDGVNHLYRVEVITGNTPVITVISQGPLPRSIRAGDVIGEDLAVCLGETATLTCLIAGD